MRINIGDYILRIKDSGSTFQKKGEDLILPVYDLADVFDIMVKNTPPEKLEEKMEECRQQIKEGFEQYEALCELTRMG